MPQLPLRLYHYTSLDSLVGIIEDGVLRASQVQFMNDAEEFKYAIELTQDLLAKQEESSTSTEEQNAASLLSESLERIRGWRHFAFCLSEKGDLLSQWRSYCPKEGGVSLGFHSQLLHAVGKEEGFKLVRCLYKPTEQTRVLDPIVNSGIQEVLRLMQSRSTKDPIKLDPAVQSFFDEFGAVAPRLKHPSFSEEKEWRLIGGPTSKHHDKVGYRAGRSMLIPYYNIPFSTDQLEHPLKDIVVGPTTHPGLSADSVGAFISSRATTISVRTSEVPYRPV